MVLTPSPEPADFASQLVAARAGSTEAQGWLWAQCRNYLLLVAGQKLDADLRAKVSPSDLVQETFLEAQRDMPQFRGETEAELLAWLRRILVNNIANATRQYRTREKRSVDREVPLAGDSAAERLANNLPCGTPTPSERAIAEEELEALERARTRLPEHYQQVLRLRYEGHLTFAAVGEIMGCSSEAARKLWARAVDQLEKELKPPNAP